MTGEIRVLIVEDDFYARNWMELLLRRDWRTKVAREVNNPVALSIALEDLNNHHEQIDLVLIDTDNPHDPNWLNDVLRSIEARCPNAAILFIGAAPNARLARMAAQRHVAGYILKDEICYSLAWAVSLAAAHHTVITPGIYDVFDRRTSLPGSTLILDGRKTIAALSALDARRSRMVFIFSMLRRELADEEGISKNFSYVLVTALYKKMGLNDILEGEVDPELYFGSHPAVLFHINQSLEHLKHSKSKKAIDKETLAFHMLTVPDIEEISSQF